MELNELRPARGANKDRKRVGRGHGSGHVKTAGKGTKGQKARSGGNVPPRFMGGQTPIHQQLPYKRGFTNIFKKRWIEVSLAALDKQFSANDNVTPELMHARGIIKKAKHDIVVLGNGEVSKSLKVSAHRFTRSAREKIEKAGGAATVIGA